MRLVIGIAIFTLATPAFGQQRPPSPGPEGPPLLDQADRDASNPGVSPVRRIDRDPDSQPPPRRPTLVPIDGFGNNRGNPEVGAANTPLLRIVPADYANGIDALSGENRPSPRVVSNQVNAQTNDRPNSVGMTDFLWQWGQFVDHDIDLTDGTNPPEPSPISVPSGDAWFDPEGTGTVEIAFNRSVYDPDSGSDPDNPRQQINQITAWIDGSNVYGSSAGRREALRSLDGSGQLKTSPGNLLPFNEDGLANAGGTSDTLFVAGDVRANEQVGLTAMHTLFMREHNRTANRLAEHNPDWSGDRLFEESRRRVAALIQVITYREFLPALLGPEGLAAYQGYNPDVDAGIANVFSTASYRMGHSLLSPYLLRLDAQGDEIPAGHLSLADAFFSPSKLIDEGIEPILRGLSAQVCQDLDVFVIDEVRNFLFGPPGAGGFDLAALNIQRGRDHGLPGYNATREAYGLPRVARLDQITRDRQIRRRLANTYDSPDQIDVWIGGLAEERRPGALVGPLLHRVLSDQFQRLRDGDRFWYQNRFSPEEVEQLEATTLADVIRRNTEIDEEIGDNVFFVDG